MKHMSRWLDPLFGLALAASLVMVVITAWPGAVRAADLSARGGEGGAELRSVADFEAVQTLGPDVLVRQGPVPTAMVQADRRLLPLLETVVERTRHGRTLVLRWKRGASVSGWPRPRVTVTTPSVSALVVSGSGELVVEALQSPRLVARVEGSGDIQLAGLVCESLALAIVGSGDIAASGRTGQLAISIAGSGDVQAEGLRAEVVTVDIAGSGDASVDAEQSLAVSIAGSGDVVYGGNASLSQRVAGSGTVRRR